MAWTWTPRLRVMGTPDAAEVAKREKWRRTVMGAIRERQPDFGEAIRADARLALRTSGYEDDMPTTLHLAARVVWLWFHTDAFFAQTAFRLKIHLVKRKVPVLPRVCHYVAMRSAQVCIGDYAVIDPGVRMPHGQVVIDGAAQIGTRTRIRPWVTIGLMEGKLDAPVIGKDVSIGTGSVILGGVTIGDRVLIGANSVVLSDVAADTTVVGAPARPVAPKPAPT